MAQWQLKILGSDPPLPFISECLEDTDWSLVQVDEDIGWHLVRATDVGDGSIIADQSYLILDRIGTLYKLRNPRSDPFSAAPPVLVKDDGSRIYFVRVDHSLLIESGVSEGLPEPANGAVSVAWILPSSRTESSFDNKHAFKAVSRLDPKAEALIKSFAYRPLDWGNIYNIIELIEKSGTKIPESLVDKKQLGNLKHTACSWGEAGRTGRHANPHHRDPPHPMSIEEGERIARRVLEAWLQSI
jgi:hypothetical protein